MRFVVALLALSVALGAAQAPASQPKGAAPPLGTAPPTPNEVIALGLVNQYRMETRNCELWMDAILTVKPYTIIDAATLNTLTVGRRYPDTTPGPVVFNAKLMAAARSILAAKIKPVNKQLPDFATAFKAAGYTPDTQGNVLIGLDAPSLRIAFIKAVTHIIGEVENRGGKAGTMIPQFAGPRMLFDKFGQWREVGIAVEEAGGKFSLVIALGVGSAKRHIGGFVFNDPNHNGICEPGEGKAGVKITCGNATTTTETATGVWSLALDDDATEVTFEFEKLSGKQPLAPNGSTQLINWRIPNAADMAAAEKLLAEVEKANKGSDEAAKRKALANLLSGTRMSLLDGAHQEKVDALLNTGINEDFAELLKKTMSAMGEDAAGFAARMKELKLPWKGTLVAWFKDAETLHQMRQAVSAALGAKADRKAFPALIAQLDQAAAKSVEPRFQEEFQKLKAQIENAPSPGDATAPKK